MTPSTGHPNLDLLVDLVHRDTLDQGVGDADLERIVTRHAPLLSAAQRDDITSRVEARVSGLGAIDVLLADPDVSEVMINGAGPVWIERSGEISVTELVLDRAEIDRLIERIVAPIGRRVDRRTPWVDGRLSDGSRVNVIVPPVALDGPYVTIRRFVLRKLSLLDFASAEVADLIVGAVEGGANILVSGGTGAGKTTLLNAIATVIDRSARIVTVEDSAELALPHPHVVRLEARPESVEGVGLVTIRDLVRNALRMRPDRLIVGEVRGEEALDMIQALNTGHAGCLSTCHANGPVDVLRRVESLALMAGSGLPLAAVREQLSAAVDLIVQVGRGRDGARQITSVAEVTGPETVSVVGNGHTISGRLTRCRRFGS